MSWTSGYNGGEEQWFIVSYLKTDSKDPEMLSEPITGGENTYTITDLEGFTLYEIRIYAENSIGRNANYGLVAEKTIRKYSIVYYSLP